MKTFFKAFFLNIFIALFLALLCEMLTRVLYPEIKLAGTDSALLKDSVYYGSAGLTRNAKGLSNGAMKYTDSRGFWKYASLNQKTDEEKTILFLGDSVTMGIGVDNDSTFAGILSSSLKNVEILNPSLIGYSSKDYLNIVKKLFVEEKNKLNISSVVIFWCLNDVYSDYETLRLPGVNEENAFGKIISFLRMNSKFFHLLKKIFNDRPKTYFLYDGQFYNSYDVHFKKSVSNLIEIKDILTNRNVGLSVILFPYEYQLREKNKDLFYPQHLFKSTLERYSIRTYDCAKALLDNSEKSDKLYLFGDGIHFSEYGHKQIERIIIEQLISILRA